MYYGVRVKGSTLVFCDAVTFFDYVIPECRIAGVKTARLWTKSSEGSAWRDSGLWLDVEKEVIEL